MNELPKIIDDLNEAARYVRNSPNPAKFMCREALLRIKRLPFATERIEGNIAFGMRHMLCEPDVAIGYIKGASFELSIVAERSK